jgi:hypothetical protein
VLCRLVNAINPACKVKVSSSKMPFQQMEAIKNALRAARNTLNVPQHCCFETNDLYDKKNMDLVLNTVVAIGSAAQAVEGFRCAVQPAYLDDGGTHWYTHFSDAHDDTRD